MELREFKHVREEELAEEKRVKELAAVEERLHGALSKMVQGPQNTGSAGIGSRDWWTAVQQRHLHVLLDRKAPTDKVTSWEDVKCLIDTLAIKDVKGIMMRAGLDIPSKGVRDALVKYVKSEMHN